MRNVKNEILESLVDLVVLLIERRQLKITGC